MFQPDHQMIRSGLIDSEQRRSVCFPQTPCKGILKRRPSANRPTLQAAASAIAI
jgi:hypothetical protein